MREESQKRTIEEEERDLLATPAGKRTGSTSAKRKKLYLRALNAENPLSAAHRGLGMLYEKLRTSKRCCCRI